MNKEGICSILNLLMVNFHNLVVFYEIFLFLDLTILSLQNVSSFQLLFELKVQ